MVWVAAVGLSILFCLPHLIRAVRTRRALHDFTGVSEDVDKYVALFDSDLDGDAVIEGAPMQEVPRRDWRKDWLRMFLNGIGAVVLWTVPGLELNLGQSTSLSFIGCKSRLDLIRFSLGDCWLSSGRHFMYGSPSATDGKLQSCRQVYDLLYLPFKISNAGNLGFIALAQLPVVFLFATKNSILSVLLGPGNGYERLNFVHRWAGRGMFIAALVHGSLWINNHLKWEFPIIGQQKETSGVAALGLLCVIAITSFRQVRMAFYEFFYVVQ